MKKNALLYLLCAIYSGCIGQTPTTSHEIGGSIGDSYYLGELNQVHFIPFNLAGGIFYKYNYDERISVKGGFHYLPIEGSDANDGIGSVRNHSFKSTIYEFAVSGEFNFLPFSHLNEKSAKLTPYGFIGFGYFKHDPKTQLEGVKYKKLQASIPLGLGLKYRAGKTILGLIWGIRKTYTDYLDDTSRYFVNGNNPEGYDSSLNGFQRGSFYSKDWFVFTGVSLSINLTSKTYCRK